MFIVNDKGTSWAYATPGFAASLNQPVLRQLRSLADVPEQAKMFTEVSQGVLLACRGYWWPVGCGQQRTTVNQAMCMHTAVSTAASQRR